jgi:hypothetical protein
MLAAKGFHLETQEEYAKRREETAAKFGGNPLKPETREQYAGRRRRHEKRLADGKARYLSYEARRIGPLPGVDIKDVQVGDVIETAELVS